MTRRLKSILDYLQYGFYSKSNKVDNEESLKLYFTLVANIITAIVLFFLGVWGAYSSNDELTLLLFTVSLLMSVNIWYLHVSKNQILAANAFLYMFYLLMIYLIHTGGVENTGPLWLYPLPPIVIFLLGFKKGLRDLFIFFSIILFILFYPLPGLLDTQYDNQHKIRMVLSFFFVILASSIYQYSLDSTFKKMEELQKDLRYFLEKDELTGLDNRRGYKDKVDTNITSDGAMLMCDIDHFKKINDTHGHSAGDFAIKEVARCIKENIRKDDLAARWGGEEFLIFLPETKINNAFFVAEKIRKSIEKNAIVYENITLKVTVSIGLSMVNSTVPFDDAIRQADSAMYISKSTGRNKTSEY